YRRVTRASFSLLLIGVVLAACSSSSKSSSSSGSGSTTTAASGPASSPAPAKSTINVGMIVEMTGPQASSARQAGNVGPAWEKWINANGGINGHPVKVFVRDDGGDPTKALAAATELINTDKVIAFAGSVDESTFSWDDLATQNHVPVISGTATN